MPGIWYRSRLFKEDHLLGETNEHRAEVISWCGRALGVVQGWDASNELAGLYISERKSGKCNQCATRQKEWDKRNE